MALKQRQVAEIRGLWGLGYTVREIRKITGYAHGTIVKLVAGIPTHEDRLQKRIEELRRETEERRRIESEITDRVSRLISWADRLEKEMKNIPNLSQLKAGAERVLADFGRDLAPHVQKARKEIYEEGARTLMSVQGAKAGIPDDLALMTRGKRAIEMVDAEIQKLKRAAIDDFTKFTGSTFKTLDMMVERVRMRLQEVEGVIKTSKDLDARIVEFNKCVLDAKDGILYFGKYLNGAERDALVRMTEEKFRPLSPASNPEPLIIRGTGKPIDMKNLPSIQENQKALEEMKKDVDKKKKGPYDGLW